MSEQRRLSGSDREFFGLVERAAFANPFGDERDALDRKIGGGARARRETEMLERVVARVSRRLVALDGESPAELGRFAGEDRRSLHVAFLFDVFHRFAAEFDRAIARQIAAGPESCRVEFAREALAALSRRGFGEAETLRLFALFYQMRRAYYFIHRGLVGRSRSMRQLREALWNNVFTADILLYERYLWNRMEEFSTLLLGETGSGKGAAAAAIGRSGWIPFDPRKGRFAESFTEIFLSINLSQFPANLIESELFGHKKGAFTGAIEDHVGVLGRSNAFGAILLDEIGEVRVPVQIQLLQVLQERIYSPVGSHDQRRFRGRVIAATNRSIDEARARGEFRDDFFYRLSSDVILVPPLRLRLEEEPGELPDLLAHVVERVVGEPSAELVALLHDAISRNLGRSYPWPGNVRELEQCARRVLLTRTCAADRGAIALDAESRLVGGIRAGRVEAGELVAEYCRLLHRRYGTYEEVARRTGLDRRTVKKHVDPRPG